MVLAGAGGKQSHLVNFNSLLNQMDINFVF